VNPSRSFVFVIFLAAAGCGDADRPHVVLYSSCDDIYARPILAGFERRTGVAVRAVYDVETDKTVGLVNRLVAERGHPRADVFWNSEVARTASLARQGLLAPYRSPAAEGIPARFRDPSDRWTGFACRARVIVYNTDRVRPEDAPRRVRDLADPRWKGRAGIGNPMTGTTVAHFTALRGAMGAGPFADWMRAFRANGGRATAGNAMVRDLVARGELDAGLTDTDDVWVGREGGKPVALVIPDQGDGEPGCLVIPNTVALVAGGPNPAHGRMLADYLLGEEVEGLLAAGRARQMPVRPGPEAKLPPGTPKLSDLRAMAVDYAGLGDAIEAAAGELRGLVD
jgi:iron(III) transport system substrate-binding protein